MFKNVKQVAKWIHLWLSLPAGVIITIICLTGAILVYQTQIERIVFPERYNNLVSDNRQKDWRIWIETAEKNLADDTITTISFSDNPDRPVHLKLSSNARVYAAVNRHTGEVQTIYNTRKEFFYVIKKLHRWLTDESRTVGRWIVGGSSIFLAVILCSGIIIWNPSKGRNRIKRSMMHFGKGKVRMLFDLHSVLGVYFIPVLLLLSLTGPIWSFAWYYKTVATLFCIETQGEEPKKRLQRAVLNNSIDWANALNVIEKNLPEAKHIEVRQDGTISILTDDSPHELATDEYCYEPSNEKLILSSKYGSLRDDRYFMGWVDVLHTGNWGGAIVRLFTFLAGLFGASLPITGYILYFRKRRFRR